MNKSNIIFVLFLFCITCSALGNTQNTELSTSALQIYLPREITVQDNTLLLGQIGIARGPETLMKKADQVTLGRFSMSGQEIVVPRNTILSRLASNGFSASDVTFIGAEEVTVKQKQQIIDSEDFTILADDFLKKNLSGNSISAWKPVRAAQEMIIPDNVANLKYSCSFEKNIQASQVKVEVSVFSGDNKIGSRSVTFRLEYESRTPVAIVDIAPGAVISTENVKIEKRSSNSPEQKDWKSPYGMLAKRAIKANTEIRDQMLASVERQIVIKRNQNVIIRIEKPGFVITAVGKTMQDGKSGDFIKVRNVDSQRIIIAKVNGDGSVEPVL
ncbi:MAG: flagellar basal body P-ring formation chaperone FlgA [Sedimentisphaerales bacterium]